MQYESQNKNDPDWEIQAVFEDNNNTEFHSNLETEVRKQNLHEPETVTKNVKRKERKKRILVNKDEWESNKNKRLRLQWQEYYGLCKKNGKWQYINKQKKRELKQACNCKHSNTKSKLSFNRLLTEQQRSQIFSFFWKLSWKEKKLMSKR